MIHASTQTARPKLHWTEVVKTEMDYKSIVATGLGHVLFDSFPSEEEFYEYLSGKEEEEGMFDFIRAQVIGVTTPTVDFIPTAEDLPAFCARVSNPDNQKNFDTAAGLLKYCMRVGHWSVFDMSNIVVEIEAPRDIARQVLRHSSIKFQEFSQRYAVAQNFVIREARLQDTKNRQNSIDLNVEESYADSVLSEEWEKRQQDVISMVQKHYQWALDNKIAKECARVILPEGNTMSYMYANGTVRQWITYLKVRDDLGVTQKEHVDLARKIKPVIIEHFPFLEQLMEK